MNVENNQIPWLDAAFFENQRNFPLEELAKYAGLHVAWNWDGNQILASGSDRDEVLKKLTAPGIDTHRVVMSYVEPLDGV